MNSLRRTLYLGAAGVALTGLLLLVVPRFFLVDVLRQFAQRDYVGPRLAGVGALVGAMLMVLIGHKIEDVWWWSWAFVIGAAGFALTSLLRAVLGPPGASVIPWWLLALGSLSFGASIVWGLYLASGERPAS
ncbi:MAG TPA: hypothetical protein VF660_00450 [Actinomycetota bacterium]